MDIKLKTVRPGAKIPVYGSPGAAGCDLYACTESPIVIAPSETALIPTGIALAVPEGYVGLIFARSGMGTKRGLAPANKVGVIDSDYRGEIFVALHNHSCAQACVEPGERIAQLAVMPVVRARFEEMEELGETARGDGGYGSTGRF